MMNEANNDYGVEINTQIAKAREKTRKLYDQLMQAEAELKELELERQDARKECNFCNDCSMCLG